jgi:Tol biopolymer transport system component
VTHALRMTLILLLATSILVVIPGEADATVPGGIGRIAFVSDADEVTGEIYVRDFFGSSPIRLTTNTDTDRSPKWSPDGTLIAFDRSPYKGLIDLFVMNDDGSSQTNLSNGVGTSNVVLDWSPDGSRILFYSDRGGNTDLWVVRPDGSDPQQLTATSTYEEVAASWSPDGSTIVYQRSSDIWAMDADGSNPRALLTRVEDDSQPAWSPDGSKVAFTSYQSGISNIWIMNADGSQPFSLTNSILWESHSPAWAPDGSKIAYVSDRDGDSDVWMMNPDGTDHAHLTDHPANEGDISWESANRDPLAVDDGDFVVHRGQSVEIDPLHNDSDRDGDALTLGDITRMPDEGTVAINPSGTVTYTHNGMTVPPNHVMPYTDSFEYRVDDARLGSALATVQVWIYPYFDDVPESNVFFDNVIWLAVQRITQGCNPPDNTLFCPAEYVTRGQMAAFLVRARSYTVGGGDDLFVDDNSSVFELDIDRLGTAEVTRGCNPPVNDRYCPGSNVTRGQMAAFLVRAFALTDLGMGNLFVDDDGSVFESDIDKLGANRVSLGCNPPANDQFCPNAYVTRQQMAAFISRAVSTGEE